MTSILGGGAGETTLKPPELLQVRKSSGRPSIDPQSGTTPAAAMGTKPLARLARGPWPGVRWLAYFGRRWPAAAVGTRHWAAAAASGSAPAPASESAPRRRRAPRVHMQEQMQDAACRRQRTMRRVYRWPVGLRRWRVARAAASALRVQRQHASSAHTRPGICCVRLPPCTTASVGRGRLGCMPTRRRGRRGCAAHLL
jgi:hypothetical protein